jgi:cellulose synthase/poly-beta-1,6-N-acetylglucosamine synthase-like glycosyltransferase
MLLDLFRAVLALICIYTARHYYFTLNRIFGRQRHPYADIQNANWPALTILVAAHNEEAVIADVLKALLEADYPADKLTIIPVNDRSTDGTRDIIDNFAAQNSRIVPFHRTGGKAGKAAALKDAMQRVATEVVLIFDADYVPGKALLRQLVTPFFDPEVGAVMGRVVPLNVGKKLLTRLLDLERSGGYQVDQQARMNLHMVPQYGGTVAGVRRAALRDIGGWNENALAEDTDLTYRLLLAGWKTVYENRAECYEEVPERWPVRVRQIMRWAKGHNQVTMRCLVNTAKSPALNWWERVDGVLLLGVYLMGPVLLLGWLLAVILFFTGVQIGGGVTVLALGAFTTLGNFAAFFEIAAAARLDGSRQRIRLLPLTLLGFAVSLISVSRAAWEQFQDLIFGDAEFVWHKTERSRTAPVLVRPAPAPVRVRPAPALASAAPVLNDSQLSVLEDSP